ncbi:MAG: MmcQ/YjbR family DNA-binding protein [Armatimonadota bacterium]|nr:MmcQ/YjbR family DNA-binding protein [Armatimonadota bacterium]
MTESEARKSLLSFEGATEGSHHGHPDFRVNNKIFATLWPGKGRSVLRLPIEMAEGIAKANPERHRLLSPGAIWGWLDVRLDLIDTEEFADLAAEAHSHVARDSKGSNK